MIAEAKAEEVAMVERHLLHILPIMEHYVDTFPTYTLHNREHIFNVMRIMGQLLGDQIDTLRGLEAVVLILSAAYHDFGMVYTKKEQKEIVNYDNFNQEFLLDQPGARVQFEENNRE